MSTVKELRDLAKELGIRGYSTANKTKLIGLLEDHSRTQELVQKSRPQDAPKETESGSTARADAGFEKPAEPKQESAPAPVAQSEPKAKKSRAPNTWNNFLKDYRAEHNCSLKEAMAQKDAYSAYKQKLASN